MRKDVERLERGVEWVWEEMERRREFSREGKGGGGGWVGGVGRLKERRRLWGGWKAEREEEEEVGGEISSKVTMRSSVRGENPTVQ